MLPFESKDSEFLLPINIVGKESKGGTISGADLGIFSHGFRFSVIYSFTGSKLPLLLNKTSKICENSRVPFYGN